jgi:hypothetical protein
VLFLAGIFGAFLGSFTAKKWGRRPTMMLGGLCFLVGAVLMAPAVHVAMLIVGRVVMGLGELQSFSVITLVGCGAYGTCDAPDAAGAADQLLVQKRCCADCQLALLFLLPGVFCTVPKVRTAAASAACGRHSSYVRLTHTLQCRSQLAAQVWAFV